MDLERLKFRSQVIQNIRSFFTNKGYLELDTPALSPDLIPETCLEIFKTEYIEPWSGRTRNLYLVPSPEIYIKKIIAQHNISVFQVSKCYRNVESTGRIHSPEFTMLEYYTMDADYKDTAAITEELFDYLRHTHGKIFIQKENQDLQSIAKGLEQITYGQIEGDFAVGHVVSCDPFLTFDWKQQGKIHTVETHLIGSYNINNVLAAVAVGRYFKIPAERISRAIAAYEPTNNRSQWKDTGRNRLIIDAYNANPSSMKAALENFAQLHDAPKAVILGDMRELGETSDALHQEIIDQLRGYGFDKVLLCGEHFSKEGGMYETFPSTDALMSHLKQYPLEGYCLLLKGSHSLALEKLIGVL